MTREDAMVHLQGVVDWYSSLCGGACRLPGCATCSRSRDVCAYLVELQRRGNMTRESALFRLKKAILVYTAANAGGPDCACRMCVEHTLPVLRSLKEAYRVATLP